jgi:hypothetical protein
VNDDEKYDWRGYEYSFYIVNRASRLLRWYEPRCFALPMPDGLGGLHAVGGGAMFVNSRLPLRDFVLSTVHEFRHYIFDTLVGGLMQRLIWRRRGLFTHWRFVGYWAVVKRAFRRHLPACSNR